jgi:hypothetical protein
MKYSIPHLGASARAALQWRLLLLWMAGLLLPTALMTFPVFQLLSAQLDYSAHVPRLARALDLIELTDLQVAAQRRSALLTGAAWLSVSVNLLLSPWLTGMAVTAARARQTAGLRELAVGGLREYPRMLRMLLLAIVLLGAVGALGGLVVGAAREAASSWTMLAALLTLALLVLVHASLDAGRAMMALDRRRRSEVASWWLGCRLLRRRLGASLLLYVAISLAGLALAAVLSWLRLQVPAIGVPAMVAGFLLTQAIVAAVAWMRIARLFALIELAREHPLRAPHG